MKYYYILSNIGSKIYDLPVGTRIMSCSPRYATIEFEEGDGPYNTFRELRKNSSVFKKLLKEDPRRAQKIFEKRFIIKSVDFIEAPNSTEYDLNGNAYDILTHILTGNIKDKKSYGVHYFNSKTNKIIELTKPPDSKGIWEARIAILNTNNNKWVEKDSASTFFPTAWNKNELLQKVRVAYINKVQESPIKFIGKTECGIDIVFILEEAKIVSVYPLYN
jgi:hypothetical protein